VKRSAITLSTTWSFEFEITQECLVFRCVDLATLTLDASTMSPLKVFNRALILWNNV